MKIVTINYWKNTIALDHGCNRRFFFCLHYYDFQLHASFPHSDFFVSIFSESHLRDRASIPSKENEMREKIVFSTPSRNIEQLINFRDVFSRKNWFSIIQIMQEMQKANNGITGNNIILAKTNSIHFYIGSCKKANLWSSQHNSSKQHINILTVSHSWEPWMWYTNFFIGSLLILVCLADNRCVLQENLSSNFLANFSTRCIDTLYRRYKNTVVTTFFRRRVLTRKILLSGVKAGS